MATKSKAKTSQLTDPICQGDIFRNVKYNYIDSEDNDGANIIEYEFPLAVIVSQACDTIAMEELVNNRNGKPAKFMPSILMCPIYAQDTAKSGQHIEDYFALQSYTLERDVTYHRDDYEVAQRDWHYRIHALTVEVNEKNVIEKAVIDFKHYFTVPITYLINHKNDRIFHLDDLFAEQITLKFSTYLARVAIP